VRLPAVAPVPQPESERRFLPGREFLHELQ